MGQDEEVSELTEQYVTYYMPALLLYGICDLYRKFLNSFSKNSLPMIAFTISCSLHPIWCQKFVVDMDLKIHGIALAGAVTNFLTYIFMRILFSFQKDLEKANHWPDSRTFNIEGLCDYFRLGIPMILI